MGKDHTKTKYCIECGELFKPYFPNQDECDDCAEKSYNEYEDGEFEE